uniref:protein-serine/threonine phosphatase n=1 Tax=Ditylum brightwellii TaxID=49249 RepID=A0A7S4R5G4_9STRA
MGNELSTAIVSPFSGTNHAGLQYGIASMQGRREYMEDSYVVIESLNSSSLLDTSLFAVFDGHGSYFCARYASQVILRVLQLTDEFASYERLETQSERDDPVGGLGLLMKAIRNTFLTIDKELFGNVERGGCTALVVVITPTHVVSANAGDSRVVLAKKRRKHVCHQNGNNSSSKLTDPVDISSKHKAMALSFDHKPMDTEEASRIKKAGGFVRGGRVNGKLGVSRSLGDFKYKKFSPYDYDPSNDIVTALPEFLVTKRNNDIDEFIVLGSDGIWDIVSNGECSEIVYNSLRIKDSDPTTACEDLLDKCYDGGSKDNMTVIIIKMPGLIEDTLPPQKFVTKVEQTKTSMIEECY